jgi:ArsR family transcriptional regulator, arsenate/arsenite/antimonite-responsive transcriptional repressor
MNLTQLSKALKALAHPHRLELYLEIAKKREANFEPDCHCLINEITKSLKIGAPTISHHLKELANADLIITERRGKYLVARINEQIVNEIRQIFALPSRKEPEKGD